MIDLSELVRRYEAGEAWASIIAAAGVSRIALWKRLTRAGVSLTRRGLADASCARCGATTTRPRCSIGIKAYCGAECYQAFMREQGAGYRQHRCGQKRARATVAKVFTLLPGMVVHHHDKDTDHNDLSNLAVFTTQSEHTSYHRGGKGLPIWDGRMSAHPTDTAAHTHDVA